MSNGHDSWKVKVHPAFLKIRKLWSDFQKGDLSSGPDGATRNALELRAEVVRFRDELLKQYPDLRPGSPSNHILAASKRFLTERDEAVGALEWLCWRRTGQPLGVLLEEEKAGSLVAHENIQRVRDDYWRAAHGESVEPFKTSADHGELMEIGLNLGLTALSDEELAACFDDLCSCRGTHDAGALRKLRARVSDRLKAAHVRSLRRIPPRQRFAAYGARGLTAKAYHWTAKGIRYVEVSRHGGRPGCLIYPNGNILAAETSQFYLPEGLDHMLEAFGVENPAQLFGMFFPKKDEST